MAHAENFYSWRTLPSLAWEMRRQRGCDPLPFLLLTSSDFWPPWWNSVASKCCIHLVVAAPPGFCPPRAGVPTQSSWAYRILMTVHPRALPQVHRWRFSPKTFQDYRNLPGVGCQLPLGRRPQPFCLPAWHVPQTVSPARHSWALNLSPVTKQQACFPNIYIVLKVKFSI